MSVFGVSGFGFSYRDHSIGISFDFGLSADCYTFVPFGRFCDFRPYRYYLPRQHVTQIFHQTTIINNNVNIHGNNNTVTINNGLVTDRVRAATRSEIRPAVVRDLTATPVRGRPTDRVQREGGSLVVYRPRLPEPSAARSFTSGGSTRTERPRETVTPRPGSPVAIPAPTSASRGERQSRAAVEQPRRTAESPTAVPRRESATPRPTQQTTRGSAILMGNRPEAKPSGQLPGTETAPPRVENNSRVLGVNPGSSRAPGPVMPRNLAPPPTPQSSPTAQRPQVTSSPALTERPGTTGARPAPQVRMDRQVERAFNPQASRPASARPQFSPLPSPASRPSYSAPPAPAAPRAPSVEARSPAMRSAPPAPAPAPSRPSTPPPSPERGDRGNRDK